MSEICKSIEIIGAIKAYRHLHIDDDEIIAALTETENLTQEEAQEYLHEYYAENWETT